MMSKIFHITDEFDERGYDSEDKMLERAFEEGCEHGYKKAMRELEGFNERGGRMGRISHRTNYREGFEEKIEKLKLKYK